MQVLLLVLILEEELQVAEQEDHSPQADQEYTMFKPTNRKSTHSKLYDRWMALVLSQPYKNINFSHVCDKNYKISQAKYYTSYT